MGDFVRDYPLRPGDVARLNPYRPGQLGRQSIDYLTMLRDEVARLERAEAEGTLATLLEDRTIGLLAGYGTTRAREAAALEEAWTRLGARVSLVDAERFLVSRHSVLDLPQMFDAVACQGVAPHWVRRLRNAPGLLIIEDLASPTHPVAAFVDALSQSRSPEASARLAFQAVLAGSLRRRQRGAGPHRGQRGPD